MGGYEREPDAVVARRHPAGLQRQAARAGLAALRGDHGRRDPAGARDRRRGGHPDDQRARGLHPRQRVHPRRVRGARLLRRRRVLRPRDRGRRRASAARWPRGSWTASRSSTCGRWTSAASAPSTGSRAYTLARTTRDLRDLLRHPLPERGAPGGPAAARRRRRTTRLPALGRVVRREVRLGAAELVRAERRRRAVRRPAALEALRPRGWAGRALEPGDRRRGARDPGDRRACSTRRRFAKIEVVGPGRGCASSQWLCANDVDVPVGSVVYTQLLNRRGGIECDLTVTRLARRPLPARDRHRVRQPRPRLDPRATCRDDGSVRVNDLTSGRACFGAVGPAGPRHPGLHDDRRRLQRGLPVPHGAARSPSATCPCTRAAGHLRRRAGLGALRPRGVRRRAVGHALERRRGRTGWSPAATGPSTRCGWRRATAPGRPTSRPRRRRSRPASGFAVALDKGRLHRSRRAGRARRPPGPRKRLRCLVLDDPRSVCLGNEPVRIDGAIVGRVTSGGYGYAVGRSIAFAYLPPDVADRARAARSTSSGLGRLRGRAGAAVGPDGRADPGMSRASSARCATPDGGYGPAWSAAARASGRGAARRGSTSPSPPATRPTRSPGSTSGATSISSASPTGRS